MPVTRRNAMKMILFPTLLPFARSEDGGVDDLSPLSIPGTIAGHPLTSDDRERVDAFLRSHDNAMKIVGTLPLSSGIPPAITFHPSTPEKKGRRGGD